MATDGVSRVKGRRERKEEEKGGERKRKEKEEKENDGMETKKLKI